MTVILLFGGRFYSWDEKAGGIELLAFSCERYLVFLPAPVSQF
ncbi:hypothetical protein [Neobittarella massiliensis]|nr:hypothetical protein [Neobittarella massiliensis]